MHFAVKVSPVLGAGADSGYLADSLQVTDRTCLIINPSLSARPAVTFRATFTTALN